MGSGVDDSEGIILVEWLGVFSSGELMLIVAKKKNFMLYFKPKKKEQYLTFCRNWLSVYKWYCSETTNKGFKDLLFFYNTRERGVIGYMAKT